MTTPKTTLDGLQPFGTHGIDVVAVLTSVALPMFLAVVDQTIVATALP